MDFILYKANIPGNNFSTYWLILYKGYNFEITSFEYMGKSTNSFVKISQKTIKRHRKYVECSISDMFFDEKIRIFLQSILKFETNNMKYNYGHTTEPWDFKKISKLDNTEHVISSIENLKNEIKIILSQGA